MEKKNLSTETDPVITKMIEFVVMAIKTVVLTVLHMMKKLAEILYILSTNTDDIKKILTESL